MKENKKRLLLYCWLLFSRHSTMSFKGINWLLKTCRGSWIFIPESNPDGDQMIFSTISHYLWSQLGIQWLQQQMWQALLWLSCWYLRYWKIKCGFKIIFRNICALVNKRGTRHRATFIFFYSHIMFVILRVAGNSGNSGNTVTEQSRKAILPCCYTSPVFFCT